MKVTCSHSFGIRFFNFQQASCTSSWHTDVHFSREPRSKLCTHCRTAVLGPGPARPIGWSGPAAGLAVGQPSWLSSSVGTAPDRVHGRTAVHHRGRSDAKRKEDAFLCGKAQRFRSVRDTGRLR